MRLSFSARAALACGALLACAVCASAATASSTRGAHASTSLVFQGYPSSQPSSQETGGSKQDTKKGGQPSPEEVAAVKRLNAAPDAAAKMKVAEELVKKNPKSPRRGQLASYMAGQIAEVKDAQQRITLSENYLAVFTEASEANYIIPVLVDSYIDANKFDEAFQVGATGIEKNPEDVTIRTQLALVGTDQVRHNNPKFAQQSQQFGLKAIELMEADKRPSNIEQPQWEAYKAKWLPQLYQSMGIIAFATGNKAEAKTKLQKALTLNATDPFTFVLIGSILNDEVQQMNTQYRAMKPGADQNAMLDKMNAQLDQVIDYYAHAVALSDGKPEYQQLHDQINEDLQTYYKYRHKGTTDGLQQLIDKYKTPAKP